MSILEFLSLFGTAWRASRRDHTAFVAAGLSFFTLFSLVPVAMMTAMAAGLIWGDGVASGETVRAMAGWMGADPARYLAMCLHGARRPGMAGWINVVVVLFGASVLFNYLRHALDLQWGLERRRGVTGVLAARFFAFLMVGVVGFFTLFFFSVHVILAMAWRHWQGIAPEAFQWVWGWKAANSMLAFVALSALFAVLYRVLPSRRLRWREAWVGGGVTSALLSAANHLIGYYFAHALYRTIYGAGATVLIVLLWVYLSAHVFLFGAEFTWAFHCAMRHGEESDDEEKEG